VKKKTIFWDILQKVQKLKFGFFWVKNWTFHKIRKYSMEFSPLFSPILHFDYSFILFLIKKGKFMIQIAIKKIAETYFKKM
jgi:hypothetical protein